MKAIGKCVIKDDTVERKNIGRSTVHVQSGLVSYGDEVHRLEIKLQDGQKPYAKGNYAIDCDMVPGRFGPQLPFCIPLKSAVGSAA